MLMAKNIIGTLTESVKKIMFVSLVPRRREDFKISCGFPCATYYALF